jgi:DNA replication licensing factor MCM4
MRGQSGSKNTISATPRQLESLIRLSEARARLRFSQYVEKEDVDEAIRLIKVATQQAATDPVTGKIDMDMITTGMATSSRQKLNVMIDNIKNILVNIIFLFQFIFKFLFLKIKIKIREIILILLEKELN